MYMQYILTCFYCFWILNSLSLVRSFTWLSNFTGSEKCKKVPENFTQRHTFFCKLLGNTPLDDNWGIIGWILSRHFGTVWLKCVYQNLRKKWIYPWIQKFSMYGSVQRLNTEWTTAGVFITVSFLQCSAASQTHNVKYNTKHWTYWVLFRNWRVNHCG